MFTIGALLLIAGGLLYVYAGTDVSWPPRAFRRVVSRAQIIIVAGLAVFLAEMVDSAGGPSNTLWILGAVSGAFAALRAVLADNFSEDDAERYRGLVAALPYTYLASLLFILDLIHVILGRF